MITEREGAYGLANTESQRRPSPSLSLSTPQGYPALTC